MCLSSEESKTKTSYVGAQNDEGSDGKGRAVSGKRRLSQALRDIDLEVAAGERVVVNFARQVADRVVLTDQGQIVERGSPAELFRSPRHERTRAFLQQVLH